MTIEKLIMTREEKIMTFKVGDTVGFKKGLPYHSYGADDNGGKAGIVIGYPLLDPDTDVKVQFGLESQTCLASELELVPTSKFKVGDKVEFYGEPRTIAEKCTAFGNWEGCWILDNGAHTMNEHDLTLVREEPAKKYYKAVAIVDGKFVSLLAGCKNELIYARSKPELTYRIGENISAPGNGIYLFTTIAGAKNLCRRYAAEKTGEWAILEGIILKETPEEERTTNPNSLCEGHPCGYARVFLPERIAEQSCPPESEEVWEDITEECTYKLGGLGNNILVKWLSMGVLRTPFIILADGIKPYYSEDKFALATEDSSCDSFGVGFRILHKVS
jgi:hypothetical protein